MLHLQKIRLASLLLTTVTCLLFTGCKPPQETGSSTELLQAGWNHYRLGEFDQAVRKFDAALLLTQPGSPEAAQIRYALATTWNLRRPGEDPERARELYTTVIENHPQSDLAAWSRLALARMQHLVPVGSDPDYDQVRAAYRDVIEHHPDHPAAEEATIYLYSTYAVTMQPGDAQRAIDGLNQFITDHPESGLLSAAYSLMAECHNTLQQPDREFQAKLKAFETREVDITNPFYDNAFRYWNLAASAEFEAGDFDTARKYYRKLIEEYPQDIRVYSSRRAIKRMDRIEARMRREIQEETP
jgi:tetratricopeptide (TPR) repeat protein